MVAVLAPTATPVVATDHEISAEDCIQHQRHGERTAIDGDGPIVTISRMANDTTVRYSFNETRPDLSFFLPEGAEVVNSSGFKITRTFVQRQYNAQDPTMTVNYTGPSEGISAVGTAQHFVFQLPKSESTTLQFRTNETAYIGDRFALLGPYEVGIAEAGCQQLQIVAPTAVSVDVDRYAQVLAEASRDLDIGPRYTVVTGFVTAGDTGPRDGYAPTVIGDGTHGASEFIVSPDAEIESARNTLVHEYVHTRQASMGSRLIAEGSATFFTVKLGVENGWISTLEADAFYAADANDDRRVADSVKDVSVPYVRGAFFFESLSEELAGTNITAESVYRQINVRNYRESLEGHYVATPSKDQLISIAEEQSNTSVDPEPRVTYETSQPVLAVLGPMVRNPDVMAVLAICVIAVAMDWFLPDDQEEESEGEEDGVDDDSE